MMTRTRNRAKLIAIAAFVATAFSGGVFAQTGAETNYPAKAVRLIVSFPPGGFADVAGRRLGEALGQIWKQPVVVDNRPGGAGIIAAQLTATSPPDGYTLLLATDGPFVINPFIYKTLPYDPFKSFEFVSMVAYTPLVLTANTNMIPSKNLSSFVTYAKAQKQSGKSLDYASSGTGGPHHLAMEDFMATAGVELNQIPYKGGAPALQDVVAGQVPVMFSALAAVLPQIQSGRIRVLGTGGPKRSALAPDIPTIAEQGYPNFAAWSWAGVVAPRGTPKPVLSKLQADITRVLADPKFAASLAPSGAEPYRLNPAEFATFLKREQAKNSKLIKSLNIKLE